MFKRTFTFARGSVVSAIQLHNIRLKPNFKPTPLTTIRMVHKEAGGGDAFDRSFYVLPNDTPVCKIDCSRAFAKLTAKEQSYAHHMARASWLGSLIVYHQVSPEAPTLCTVLYKLFAAQSFESLEKLAKDTCKFTDAEWTSFTVFTAAFIHNNGNYKGFGDTKFVPNVEPAKLSELIAASEAAKQDGKIKELWAAVQSAVFSLDEKQRLLGMPAKGTTTYHSATVTESDTKFVDKFFASQGIEAWNTRLLKHSDKEFEVRFASAETGDFATAVDFEGVKFRLVKGDYSELLTRVVQELQQAKKYAANDHEANMISEYVKHFTTGSLEAHKQGSRHWIKNVGPTVETYIGFIENYRDPVGSRSEFEGFVACVDKETSRKFGLLVDNAEEILPRLPWGADYEKDKFLRPDFTSLDVLAFGSSGPPAGINIPNYDEIRQDEGFKNVSLGNVIAAMPDRPISFLNAEDQALFKAYYKQAFEVQVGLHELLGHGSGKLFYKHNDGTYNFDHDKVKDLETGGKVSSWYKDGETWSTQFRRLASAYEECRAEAVGYFLCCFPDVLKIFDYEGEEADTVKYVNWLSEMRAGLVSMEMYSPEKQAWGQAHSHARHVLLRVCMERGDGFIKIDQITNADDGKPDIVFTCDRSKIDSVGKPAIYEFLKLLQLYKSTAAVDKAEALFTKYSSMDDYWLALRKVVVERRQPRRLNVQPNTKVKPDGSVELVAYDESPAGLIASHVERFADDTRLWQDMNDIAARDAKHWRTA